MKEAFILDTRSSACTARGQPGLKKFKLKLLTHLEKNQTEFVLTNTFKYCPIFKE